jgi:hypothetical protein
MKDLRKAFQNPPVEGRLTPDLKTSARNDFGRPVPNVPTGHHTKAGFMPMEQRMIAGDPSAADDMSRKAERIASSRIQGAEGPNSAREAFEAGIVSARTGIRRSGSEAVGQPDMRNHARDYPSEATIREHGRVGYHEVECGKAGYGPINSKTTVTIPEGIRSDGKPE